MAEQNVSIESTNQVLTLPLYKESVLILGDLDTAKKLLTTEDLYVKELSTYDRMCRLNASQPVAAEEFMDFQAAAVIAWKQTDLQNWTILVKIAKEKLEAIPNLPVPPVVHLNHTTGIEEGRAAYTRGNGIFLPTNMVDWSSIDALYNLRRLFLHEMWHIISRQLPAAVRDRVYNTIGFLPCGHVFHHPAELTRISNPDAVLMEHYIEVKFGERSACLVPIIFANTPDFEPDDKNFFSRVVRSLITVEKNAETNTWIPARLDGKLLLLTIQQMPASFWSQVGRNTFYIIHPEETIADNFAWLVNDPRSVDVRSPEILEKIRVIFS